MRSSEQDEVPSGVALAMDGIDASRSADWRCASSGASLLSSAAGSAATFELSTPTDHLEAFISHNWSVGRGRKWLALLLHYNFSAALVCGILIAAVLCVVSSVDGCRSLLSTTKTRNTWACTVLPVVFWRSTSSSCSALMSYLASSCATTMSSWTRCASTRSTRSCNARGLSLLAVSCFTREHGRLVHAVYTTKVWTVYEMACFLSVHPGGRLVWRLLTWRLRLCSLPSSSCSTMWPFGVCRWYRPENGWRFPVGFCSCRSCLSLRAFCTSLAMWRATRPSQKQICATSAFAMLSAPWRATARLWSATWPLSCATSSFCRRTVRLRRLCRSSTVWCRALSKGHAQFHRSCRDQVRISLVVLCASFFRTFDVVAAQVFAGASSQTVVATVLERTTWVFALMPLGIAFLRALSGRCTHLIGGSRVLFVLLLSGVWIVWSASVNEVLELAFSVAREDLFALVLFSLVSAACFLLTYFVFSRAPGQQRRRRTGADSETMEDLAEALRSYNQQMDADVVSRRSFEWTGLPKCFRAWVRGEVATELRAAP